MAQQKFDRQFALYILASFSILCPFAYFLFDKMLQPTHPLIMSSLKGDALHSNLMSTLTPELSIPQSSRNSLTNYEKMHPMLPLPACQGMNYTKDTHLLECACYLGSF